LAGLGTAAYFVEFRGVGFATLAAAETAPELVIVGGALLALSLVTYLGVSRALATIPGEVSVRGMLRHALTLADAPPEEIEDELDTLPSEMQDLVRMLAAQRLRSEGTGREIQSLRHEINAIQQGMQRSALSLEPLRLDGASEVGRAVATAWNQLLERVQSSAPGEDTPRQEEPLADTSHLELQALRQRLEFLESRCSRLEEGMLSSQSATQSPEPSFAGGTADLILGSSEPEVAPAEDDALAWKMPPVSEAKAEVAQAPDASSPSGYHEWTGHASAGDWKLNREAKEALEKDADLQLESSPGFGPSFSGSGADDLVLDPSGSTPPVAEPFVDDTYPLSPEAPRAANPASSEFSLPHFVGKPAGPAEGRVEVTFDGQRREPNPAQDEDVSVDPDGSAIRPGSVIFDLRSLGAVELDD
jgi:hypothetical protein